MISACGGLLRNPFSDLRQNLLGCKAFPAATATLGGIKMVHMMRKRQGRVAFNPAATLKEQFKAIAA